VGLVVGVCRWVLFGGFLIGGCMYVDVWGLGLWINSYLSWIVMGYGFWMVL
jgi:hypothetical protein